MLTFIYYYILTDSDEEEVNIDDEELPPKPSIVKVHQPLDLRHVINMIDKGHHSSDQLLLPSYMYKAGNLVARLFKPREQSKSLSVHNVSKQKKTVNHRLIAELHKYYLRFGPHHERYTELWSLYVAE